MEEMSAKKRRSSTMSNNSSSSTTTATVAVERKEIERRRRQHMNSLCVKLASLIPKEHYSSKVDAMTQLGSLDEAATYIMKLKERVEELRQKRTSAQLLAAAGTKRSGGGGDGASTSAASDGSGAVSEEAGGHRREDSPPAVVDVRQDGDGSSMDVVLISSVERPFKLHEVITVLEEEGAETVNANFSVAGAKIFYTIHCRAFCPRIGIEVSRVSERLRALGR